MLCLELGSLAAEAFGKAIREGTKLVIAVPDATEFMNRAFATFAYALEGGGAALVTLAAQGAGPSTVSPRNVCCGASALSVPTSSPDVRFGVGLDDIFDIDFDVELLMTYQKTTPRFD